MKKLRKVTGDHDFSLEDTFSRRTKVITQTAFFRSGDFVVAIGELNLRNRWNDEEMDRAISFLEKAWNDAVKADAMLTERAKVAS